MVISLLFADMSDFIVGDDGKPIHRRKGEAYFLEPYAYSLINFV